MRVEKEAVVTFADFGEGGAEEDEGGCEGCEAEDYVGVADTFEEEVFLDVEV